MTKEIDRRTLPTIAELKARIEEDAQKLGLDALKLMQEYGINTALAEMLEKMDKPNSPDR